MRETCSIKIPYDNRDAALAAINAKLAAGAATWIATQVLVGKIDQTGAFWLSSRARGAGISCFTGRLEQWPDGLYLVGQFGLRQDRLRIAFVLMIATSLLGGWLLTSGQAVFTLAGPFFLFLPWINLWLIRDGRYLRRSLEHIFND